MRIIFCVLHNCTEHWSWLIILNQNNVKMKSYLLNISSFKHSQYDHDFQNTVTAFSHLNKEKSKIQRKCKMLDLDHGLTKNKTWSSQPCSNFTTLKNLCKPWTVTKNHRQMRINRRKHKDFEVIQSTGRSIFKEEGIVVFPSNMLFF